MRTGAVVAFMVVVAAAAAGLTWYLMRPVTPPPPPPPPPPAATLPKTEEAKDAVVAYLKALGDGRYRAAYKLLSEESRAAHSYEQFATQARRVHISYDLAAITHLRRRDAGHVTITVPQAEDPAPGAFETVWEDGQWRVIFLGGNPWFPYAHVS